MVTCSNHKSNVYEIGYCRAGEKRCRSKRFSERPVRPRLAVWCCIYPRVRLASTRTFWSNTLDTILVLGMWKGLSMTCGKGGRVAGPTTGEHVQSKPTAWMTAKWPGCGMN